MADNFSYNEFRDRTLVLNAKILTPPGHNPHPNSYIDFDTQKEANVSRAFALSNLQKTRTTIVDRETLRRSLMDTMGTHSVDLRSKVMVCNFQELDGLFSARHNFQRSTFSVWAQVWVLIVLQIRHDSSKPDPMADGEQLEATRIVIYDAVASGQAQREQIIRQRMPRILQEGDIALPAGGLEVPASDVKIRLLPQIDIHSAMHAANPPSVFGGIFMDTQARVVDRARSRIIGILLTGASLDNSWKAIGAIELPGQSSKSNDYNPNDMIEPASQRAPTPIVIDPDTPDTSMEVDDDEPRDDGGNDNDPEMIDLTDAARGVRL
ncbi:hypothetical protein DL762_004651 [Monosporascus cannonballus]|uniref:Uncharacterized protein n=1 Tax=Monosporascus cannonballus TaxID=155416 RepID=A0ABY0H8A2_9PEZI|nr:hypothetical protein DL762_004651 [Monosporascus cannonballus]RYO95879.1 hypothetical protein DL763_003513 [Monosporascus cannonballus]